MYRVLFVATLSFLSLGAGAASCPPGSAFYSQVVQGNQEVTTCRCLRGYVAENNKCVRVPTSLAPDLSIKRLRERLDKIPIPYPIPITEVSIHFGLLAPQEETSKRVLLGLEMGVATVKISGSLLGVECIGCKLILATGNTVIAGENGAEVYLIRQDRIYREALRLLREPKTSQEFTAIVRALRNGKPLPEDAKPAMVQAAKAILDPRLGNSGLHMAWDALWSPQARGAMLTRATIELGGEVLGESVDAGTRQILSARNPTVHALEDVLTDARNARSFIASPEYDRYLQDVIAECNTRIADTYAVQGVTGHEITSLFAKWAADEGVVKKDSQP